MERDSFVFYRSFYEASKYLSNEDKGILFDMICQYWLCWNSIEWDWPSMWMFLLIKPQLDANNKRYINWCKWWEYWKLGWRPQKNWENSQKPQTNPKLTPNDNVNDNVNVNENNTLSKDKVQQVANNISSEEFKCIRDLIPSSKGGDSVAWEKIYNTLLSSGACAEDIKKVACLDKMEIREKIRDIMYSKKKENWLRDFCRQWEDVMEARILAILKARLIRKNAWVKFKENTVLDLANIFGREYIEWLWRDVQREYRKQEWE